LNNKSGSKVFPCIYAGRGYRADELHFLFLHSDDLSEPRNVQRVATALRGYLANARATGYHTSLVIMTPNDTLASTGRHKSLEQYRHEYWEFARKLRRLDPKPWPASIPKDTTSNMWCWCFDGIECFMVSAFSPPCIRFFIGEPLASSVMFAYAFQGNMNPAYEQRQTRQADNLCIVYQPKWIFAELFKTDERREAATNKVRGLIKDYDGVDISPDISNYGSPGSREARQHFLWDSNVTSECHFREV
jgi:FPC/CPF motif-containing protein YcgG